MAGKCRDDARARHFTALPMMMTNRRYRMRAGVLTIVMLTGSCCASLHAQDGEACLRLFGADLKSTPLGESSLSESQLELLTKKRACVRSYGLPGGADALKRLSSDDLYRDKQRMYLLFDIYDDMLRRNTKDSKAILAELKSRLKDPTMEDFQRLLHLPEWDRTQVTLYGEWLYLRKLREEGQYLKSYNAATELAKRFQLRLQRAQHTEADEHTYFSATALGNFILIEQFTARSRLLTAHSLQPSDLRSLLDLLDNEANLEWQYEITGGDPVHQYVRRLAGLYGRVATTTDGEELTAIGRLNVVAGYFKDTDRRVVLLKGAKRIYGIVEDEDGVHLSTPSVAARQFREFTRNEVATKSTSDMRLFAVHSYDGKFEVDLGNKTFTVTAAEFKDLQVGKKLPESHPLHQEFLSVPVTEPMVLYTNPLAIKAGLLQSRSDDFVFALQKAYSDRSVYRDPFSERTAKLARQLNVFVSNSKNMYAVVADDSFAVQDYKILQNVKSDLQRAGVTMIPFTKANRPTWSNGTGKAVIVITGHIDANLAAFITALGERGYFEGNYVVFSSCRSPLSRQLVNRITDRFKAAATYSFDSKIQTSSVEEFLVDLATRTAADPSASFDFSVRAAAKRANLNGVWTICEDILPTKSPFQARDNRRVAA